MPGKLKRNLKRLVLERVARLKLDRRREGSTPPGAVPVNVESLAPYKSYGAPQFVRRGYYLDVPFRCSSCHVEQVFSAAQQRWWYEIAKGYVYSTARLCRSCRRREQARKAAARKT